MFLILLIPRISFLLMHCFLLTKPVACLPVKKMQCFFFVDNNTSAYMFKVFPFQFSCYESFQDNGFFG